MPDLRKNKDEEDQKTTKNYIEITDLPNEILNLISSNLSIKQLFNLSKTSKHMRAIAAQVLNDKKRRGFEEIEIYTKKIIPELRRLTTDLRERERLVGSVKFILQNYKRVKLEGSPKVDSLLIKKKERMKDLMNQTKQIKDCLSVAKELKEHAADNIFLLEALILKTENEKKKSDIQRLIDDCREAKRNASTNIKNIEKNIKEVNDLSKKFRTAYDDTLNINS